jgi:hypothetical protein
VTGDLIASLRTQLARDADIRSVVNTILDRCDRNGTLPARMTIHFGSLERLQAAIRLLSSAAVRHAAGELTARLDLAREDARLRDEGKPGLSEILYTAAGRSPRNLRQEAADFSACAAAAALALATRHRGAAVKFLGEAAQRLAACRGELFELGRSAGIGRLEDELDLSARCIELAEYNEAPVRLANFARRATGSTKGLRAGQDRYVRVTDALLMYVPALAERVTAEAPAEHPDKRRLALECLNIFRNETPIDVLCWGHFVLEKHGKRLDAPAFHHGLGEPCRLLLLHLRDAEVREVQAERVVTIENETTFNDYIDWLRASRRNEIVLLSEGQANWAVVRLLRLLIQAAPSTQFLHWGDMDRFGVLILRSLRRRTGVPIEPLWMDVRTFESCRSSGLPLSPGEAEDIQRVISASVDEVGSDLLRAILKARRWVEQEAVAEQVLQKTLNASNLSARAKIISHFAAGTRNNKWDN